eukprot:gene9347-biopygen11895
MPGGTPFRAAGRMVAQGGAKGGPRWNLRHGVYSPVGLLFPQRGACGADGGAGWRQGGPPLEPEPKARGVLPRGTPFLAAGRMVAHGGAKGDPPLEPKARGVLPRGTTFPAAGRMVAQGGAKGAPLGNLRHGVYSPVGLLFPQRGA